MTNAQSPTGICPPQTGNENLYAGWMIGFSAPIIEHLYFEEKGNRRNLLRWIQTYENVLTTYKLNNIDDVIAGLEKMKSEASGGADGSVRREVFETWTARVEGALLAQMPSAHHSRGLAAELSRVKYSETTADVRRHLHDALHWIGKLKAFAPTEGYTVVQDDLLRLYNACPPPTDAPSPKVGKHFHGNFNEEADRWGGLIMGESTSYDLLTPSGKAMSWCLLVLTALTLASAIGAGVFFPFYFVAQATHTDLSSLTLTSLSSLLSSVQVLVAMLGAMGISFALLTQKLFGEFGTIRTSICIWLAGRSREWGFRDFRVLDSLLFHVKESQTKPAE